MAKIDLSKYGITGTTEVVYNPSYEDLFAEETKPELEGYEKGQVTELGAVNVMTGIYTGRSPKDKFFVYDEVSKNTVWWTSDEYKNDNKPVSEASWKALIGCDITGFPIQRVGEGYHSTDSTSEFSSATAVRGVISTLIDIDKHNIITNMQLDNSWISTKFSQLMPSDCADILVNCILGGHIVFPDDISEMLYYRLLTGKDKGFAQYADCTKELTAKIVKNIYKYESFTQFCNLLKSKNLTYTRISRVLTHILLGIENNDFNICMDNPYLRILGFKKSSGELMHLLKKRASTPIITKVADAPYELISKDTFAADLYGRLCHSQQNEFTHGVVII